jgi:hypothetical protein
LTVRVRREVRVFLTEEYRRREKAYRDVSRRMMRGAGECGDADAVEHTLDVRRGDDRRVPTT